jgi:hypothetical protein
MLQAGTVIAYYISIQYSNVRHKRNSLMSVGKTEDLGAIASEIEMRPSRQSAPDNDQAAA